MIDTLISQAHLLYTTTIHLQEFKTLFSSFMSPSNAKMVQNRGDIYCLHTPGLPTIYISCSQQFVVIFISFNKTLIINCFITIG